MFDSSLYNLSNPAFTEDIGEANLNRILPMPPASLGGSGCGYIPGITGTMDNITLRGPLEYDQLNLTQKQKDKRGWKTVLKAVMIAAGTFIGYKFCKKGLSGIKNLFTKLKK